MKDTRGRSLQPISRRPVDLVHLARYTLGKRSSEREILHLFRTQANHYLKRLRDAVGDTAWRHAARTIKSSALGIGAWRKSLVEFHELGFPPVATR